MTTTPDHHDVAIVGAGFTGLTAAYRLARDGYKVCVLEADDAPGGLAGTFTFSDGARIEKFYHHWFTSDVYVSQLVRELGHEDDVEVKGSRTGMYFNGRIWKLSTPLDLLRFTALSFWDRIRLGLTVFQVRRVRDWRKIEHLSVREWLEPIVGRNVYKVVWEPLIESKFSVYAEDISAVWFWNKLVLRGGSRDKKGEEKLAYFRGGFGRLADLLVAEIRRLGGEVRLSTPVQRVHVADNRVEFLDTGSGPVSARQVLFTPAFPIIADLFEEAGPSTWVAQMRRIHYLGNICLVLRLNRSLSQTYWLNVNDPGFPFVGVIEHTNFDDPENYNGTHIVYLSKYLPTTDPIWAYSDEEYAQFAIGHLQRMFPELEWNWIVDYKTWRADYAQPIAERNYSKLIPGQETPYANAFVATMAQIYPEDRGTNYAIREGFKIAKIMSKIRDTHA